jgi:cyclase
MSITRIQNFRIIARLDVKNNTVIKGIHLEGLRQVGVPGVLAKKYYEDGIDEVLFMDAVASLYGRNHLFDILADSSKEIFVPMTVGGGLKDIEDVRGALGSGADKISANTAFVKNPEFISKISKKYGAQCCVCSIEAKKISDGKWEVYVDNGRESTGIFVDEWIKKVTENGAGELLITSIDREGTKKGFDFQLYKMARTMTTIPIIASGGAGTVEHIKELRDSGNVNGVALASVLHYGILSVGQIKEALIKGALK